MADTTITNEIARARWGAALARLEQADAAYEEYYAAVKPLLELRDAFEARHGLIAPGNDRNPTPGYFEKRDALFAAHPEYQVPDEIHDRLEKFVEAICEAQTLLMETPAPDLVALRWKLEHTSGACFADSYIAQMNADIQSLLVEA